LIVDFLEDLKRVGAAPQAPDAQRLLRAAALCSTVSELACKLPYRPNCYTRTLLHEQQEFEILLLRWAPGAFAPIHDHGLQRCYFAIVEGTLSVDNYRRVDGGTGAGEAKIVAVDNAELTKGEIDARIEAWDLHRVANRSAEEVLTLHVYARPVKDFLVYDEARNSCSLGQNKPDFTLSALSL